MTRFALLALACLTAGTALYGETGGKCAIVPVEKVAGSIRVAVNPRVELMSIAQTIGGFRERHASLLARDSSLYRQDVERAFSSHRSHRAVTMVADLSRSGFSFSRPPFVMLHLDDSFNMRRDIIPDALAMKLSGGEERVRELAREMANFCEESNFATFYEEHRGFYIRLVDEVARNLSGQDYIHEIESFYGVGQKNYTLVLVPLYAPVGFGPRLALADGSHEVFSILGPRRLNDGVESFALDSAYFQYMQRHEFSHSFVNPLAEANRTAVERLASLFQKMPEVARRQMCGDWEECLNEQVIRAVTTYLAYTDGEAAGNRALEAEKKRGAVLIDELLAGVREYASARDRYPTFESYYPVLLHRLERLLSSAETQSTPPGHP